MPAMTYRHPGGSPLHHERLKTKQRELREGFAAPLSLRVHRALSWLRRAEAEGDDEDVRFILLWIGFNAAYAGDVDASRTTGAAEGERGLFQAFFTTLVGYDGGHRIYDMVWQRFPHEIRVLLANQFVFGPFWQHRTVSPATPTGRTGWIARRSPSTRRWPTTIRQRSCRSCSTGSMCCATSSSTAARPGTAA